MLKLKFIRYKKKSLILLCRKLEHINSFNLARLFYKKIRCTALHWRATSAERQWCCRLNSYRKPQNKERATRSRPPLVLLSSNCKLSSLSAVKCSSHMQPVDIDAFGALPATNDYWSKRNTTYCNYPAKRNNKHSGLFSVIQGPRIRDDHLIVHRLPFLLCASK